MRYIILSVGAMDSGDEHCWVDSVGVGVETWMDLGVNPVGGPRG